MLTDAWECAAQDALFRADLPLPSASDYDEALAAHLNRLKDRFVELLGGDRLVERVKALQRSYPVQRTDYQLPSPSRRIEDPAASDVVRGAVHEVFAQEREPTAQRQRR